MIFSTLRCLGFSDVFSSGKYAGEKVCFVMAKDVGYLWFMEKNGTVFSDNVKRCLRGIKKDNKKWGNNSKSNINKL